MDNEEHFDESFRLIRQRFVEKLGDQLPMLLTIKEELKKEDYSSAEEMRMQMHKLAGTSGTFGFPELSHFAAEAETLLDRLIGGDSSDQTLSALQEAISDFHQRAETIIASAADTGQEEQGAEALEKTDASPHKYHIVVADDDELVRDLLKQSLSSMSCTIVEATQGREVLEIIQKIKTENTPLPDLIILDVNMPGMSGFEVLKQLKSETDSRTVPVIMLTRQAEDEHVIEGISSGAIDYITKPFAMAELAGRISATLKRHSTKILVADDDGLIRDLLYKKFTRMGYSVLSADNGNDALKTMSAMRPDIAVLDIMMPGMDGLSVLRQAKDDPALTEIPVVMLTAKGQQENVLKGLETGAHDYISKPFDVDEVVARVSGILLRRKHA